MRYTSRRKQLRQNFLVNRGLLRRLLKKTSITANDVILDIGAGSGNLTKELIKTCDHVIAIETDPQLITQLRKTFRSNPKIIVVNNDFLKFHLPETSYKVFANIPFNLQTEIVNKLFVDPKKTPVDCYLIVEHKFAAKLMRRIDIYCRYLHHFHRTDFYPQPYTHTVLVHIRKQIV